jgi:hypothetical protein
MIPHTLTLNLCRLPGQVLFIIYYEKVMLKIVIYFTTVKIIVFYKFSLDRPLTLIYCLHSHINNYEFFCKILYTFKFIDWKKEHIDQLVTDPYNT